MKKINCFIPFENAEQATDTVNELRQNAVCAKVFLLKTPESEGSIEGCEEIAIDSLYSSATIKKIAAAADAEFALLYTKYNMLRFGPFALERMAKIASDTMSGMVYADHYNGDHYSEEGLPTSTKAPVIDYQFGSLRDDFDFGSVLLFCSKCLKKAADAMKADYKHAGLYDLRLKLSQFAQLTHINEFLYSDIELDTRKSGEKMFDYVDPKNRGRQIEMEQACTEHLKEIGGYLAPEFKHIEFSDEEFPVEATVVIPVRTRERTIADAIDSALMQKCDFKFNVIIVDNCSTDRTTEIIKERYGNNPQVIHMIVGDIGVGACWNLAAHHSQAGKFCVQLDSDDVYEDENTLTTMVNAFYEQNCAMVVGSYTLTDINRNILPPGLVDHREWTPDNGRNNALRINGLGAPRAFYTPVLREVKLPAVNYGEDYALGLNMSRIYQIGRVYKSVYLCRRWDDNSDAALDVEKMNRNNTYKDRIRTWELMARVAMNKAKK